MSATACVVRAPISQPRTCRCPLLTISQHQRPVARAFGLQQLLQLQEAAEIEDIEIAGQRRRLIEPQQRLAAGRRTQHDIHLRGSCMVELHEQACIVPDVAEGTALLYLQPLLGNQLRTAQRCGSSAPNRQSCSSFWRSRTVSRPVSESARIALTGARKCSDACKRG